MAILVLSPLASKTLNQESTLATVRLQAALVRTLLDELDRVVPASGLLRAPSCQLAEEVVRLGCRLVDAATEIAAAANETSFLAAAVGAIQCDGATLRAIEHVEGVRARWTDLDPDEPKPLEDDSFDDDSASCTDPESAIRITAAAVTGSVGLGRRGMHRSG